MLSDNIPCSSVLAITAAITTAVATITKQRHC
jgi:hypothetical protein